MEMLTDAALLLVRREEEAAPACGAGNEFDGRIGLRVSAIFVIWVSSTMGALLPVLAKQNPKRIWCPEWVFFVCKYFGSGVIVATAFIHLLTPANEALTDPCLSGPITEYPWAQGIALMAVFGLFLTELLAIRYARFTSFTDPEHTPSLPPSIPETPISDDKRPIPDLSGHHSHRRSLQAEPHLSHTADHVDHELDLPGDAHAHDHSERYAAQLTSLFILEFGVIFHSVFIGLTLAVAGEEFTTLYIVLVFHQLFEGLGLGTRLSSVNWPTRKQWTPHLMALAYGLSTPIAIAVGLGVRKTYPPGSQTTLIVNGVFDAMSAGILLYTGMIEFMAHEFLYSHALKNGPARDLFLAFALMVAGAFLMALLGKWA